MCVGLNFHHLAFQSVLMFNIDPVTWKFFTRNNDVGFGYRVIQRDTSRWEKHSLYM